MSGTYWGEKLDKYAHIYAIFLTAACGIDLHVATEWNNAVFSVQLEV